MSNQFYLPDVITNPAQTIWDIASAFPFGIFSMTGTAPQGSYEARVRAVSSFIPAAAVEGKKVTPIKQWLSFKIEEAKKTSPEVRQAWETDTIPDVIPGQEALTKLAEKVLATDWTKLLLLGGAAVVGLYLLGGKN